MILWTTDPQAGETRLNDPIRILWLSDSANLALAGHGTSFGRGLVRELRALGIDAQVYGYYDVLQFDFNHPLDSRFHRRIIAPMIRQANAQYLRWVSERFLARRLLHFVRSQRIAAIVSNWLYPGLLSVARSGRLPLVLWSMDDPMNHSESWFELARRSAAVFTYSKGAIEEYAAHDVSDAKWLPLGYDPTVYHPINDGGPKENLVFVGSNYTDRSISFRAVLMPLIAEFGPRLHVYGDGWSKRLPCTVHPFVDWREIPHIYARAKIVIGLHREPSRLTRCSVNFRVFEALGCGACLLSDYVAGIEELFCPGTELLVAKEGDSPVELAHAYLGAEEERNEIGRRGLEAVRSRHTVSQRASVLAEELFGLAT